MITLRYPRLDSIVIHLIVHCPAIISCNGIWDEWATHRLLTLTHDSIWKMTNITCLSFSDPFQTQGSFRGQYLELGLIKWCTKMKSPETANSFWSQLVVFDGAALMDIQKPGPWLVNITRASRLSLGSLSEKYGAIQVNTC